MQVQPLCARCVHFHRRNKDSNTCNAFPQGIPMDILRDKVDHNFPVKGDNGIQFYPVPPIMDEDDVTDLLE